MNLSPLFATALAVMLPVAAAHSAEKFSCPRTLGSVSMPGSMFPASRSWYGTEALAVLLQEDGSWFGLGPEYDFREKLWWYSAAFQFGMESRLKVAGRKLDGDAPPAKISRATNAQGVQGGGWAMLMLVEFPSAGCWELTGEFQGQQLSFVVETRGSAPAPAAAAR